MKRFLSVFTVIVFAFTLSSCTDDEVVVIPETNLSHSNEEEMVETIIYPHDEVVSVNIEIDTVTYDSLISNAQAEEYVLCDITYNGYTLNNVAIRTKGNSSLRDVAEAGGDRFSWNIDLNLYEDQDLFGVDKIILNNIYRDPTMMAEYLTYEALDSLDAVTPRTTFVELSINDEYYGLYLSVEQIGNEFVELNYGDDDGELYKPENGTGANLNYVGDTTNYSALYDKLDEESSNDQIIAFMAALQSGENIEELFNIDSYLKYLAVSTYTVNLDSYQGGIYHNYYLYNNDGMFEWIGWDYNMSFNGFPMVNLTDSEAVTFLIDEPTIGSLDNYALTSAILANEEYLETYHQYLQSLLDGYFDYDTLETRVEEIKDLIDDYVETDPSSFYSYTEYENSIYSTSTSTYGLLQFVQERSQNIQDQLDGVIPSSNNGDGNGSSIGPGVGRPRG